MVRSILISLSKAKWAQRLVTHWRFAWRLASRFIAGQDLAEAVDVVRQLNLAGINATLDQLGENTSTVEEANIATDGVIEILQAIKQYSLRCNVSVKLSQLGLTIDEDLCRKNLRKILEMAVQTNCFLRIDMEDSSLTERTIGAYRWALDQGYTNVGIVIQSYLYRSEADIRSLAGEGLRVRLCKGAYLEPADIAFPQKAQVDSNYDRLVDLLMEISSQHGFPRLSSSGSTPPIPALATHDPQRIAYAKRRVEEAGIPRDVVEFQMLYGIRRDLQVQLVQLGYPVRVYVPFGTHWYPYFMRRLAERPANIWFFVTHFFRK